jgi:capsular polysaccharide biosynthesis protein
VPPRRPTRPENASTAYLTEVDDAVLSPFETGPLRRPAGAAPRQWTRGAVHDSLGRLVVESQRLGGEGGDHVVAADPRIWSEPAVEVLSGRWLYGGSWMGHFGHFLTETLTTLWVDAPDTYDGIVFHGFIFDNDVHPWQATLLRMLGTASVPAVVADGGGGVRVESLVVPSRTVFPNLRVMPEAVAVWRQIADAAPPALAGPSRVFLSRSRTHALARAAGRPTPRAYPDDLAVDDAFASAGWLVVHPETLPVQDQVALAASATALAGPAGSALHLGVFAAPGTPVLEVGDSRSPHARLPAQSLLDDALGHEQHFVPFDSDDPHRVLERVEAFLAEQ